MLMPTLEEQLTEFVNSVETSVSPEETQAALVSMVWAIAEHLVRKENEKG